MDGVDAQGMGILYTHGNVRLPTVTATHELITTTCSMCSLLFNQAAEVLPKEMALLATISISPHLASRPLTTRVLAGFPPQLVE